MTPAITVDAGPHDRHDCPVWLTLPESLRGAECGTCWELASDDGARAILQAMGSEGVLVERRLAAGTRRTYRAAASTAAAAERVQVRHDPGRGVAISCDGDIVTRYVYGDAPARPYFYPLCGPGGVELTRSFPMLTGVPRETNDHKHHRSVWIAHGDVNGTDNWSEEPGHGRTVPRGIEASVSGRVAGRFTASGDWVTASGERLLGERLTVTAYATSADVRILDFVISLSAYVPVRFGDTKEGGILSVRVASSMDVPRGGRIENSVGGVGEGETWGRSAHWCDYSGMPQGIHLGIAILDAPDSFRHPVRWHVREYGLMTANPFGYSAFTGGRLNGAYDIVEGEALQFRYRMVLHRGDAEAADIRSHYTNLSAPLRTSVED